MSIKWTYFIISESSKELTHLNMPDNVSVLEYGTPYELKTATIFDKAGLEIRATRTVTETYTIPMVRVYSMNLGETEQKISDEAFLALTEDGFETIKANSFLFEIKGKRYEGSQYLFENGLEILLRVCQVFGVNFPKIFP